MNYSNEVKVGIAIVVSAIIFFLGVRYFQDIPLFRGSDTFHTLFDEANGLLSGNAVRINGVNVGSVKRVEIQPETRQVRIDFSVDSKITVPEGSYATIEGFSAIGSVHLAVHLGPPGQPAVESGGFIPGRREGLLGELMERAPELVQQVDTMLAAAGTALGEAGTLLQDPNSNLNQTLVGLRNATASLNRLLQAEQARLGRVLANVESLSGDLSTFTGENADSLGLAIQNLNVVLRRLDQNLVSLEATTAGLDSLVVKVDRGDGTLGLLLNDPSLYLRLDSAVTSLNDILNDFQNNPARYLRELTLIDIF